MRIGFYLKIFPPLWGEAAQPFINDAPCFQALFFSSDTNAMLDLLRYNIDNKDLNYTNKLLFSCICPFLRTINKRNNYFASFGRKLFSGCQSSLPQKSNFSIYVIRRNNHGQYVSSTSGKRLLRVEKCV